MLWHYFWKTKGGTHIGNRGVGMWGNYLFFVTPDNYLISLDAGPGKERWHKELASFQQQYFHTMAPMVIDNHVLVGSSNDLDMPGFLQSFDPETGELQWKWYATPQNAATRARDVEEPRRGTPRRRPSVGARRRTIPRRGSTSSAPGIPRRPTRQRRAGEGLDNLFTCALVAINVDTGKMAWYYQTSPHDTHDWDSAQTPVLVDGEFNGRPRKTGADGGAQRLLLRRRSRDRRAPGHEQVLGHRRTGRSRH